MPNLFLLCLWGQGNENDLDAFGITIPAPHDHCVASDQTTFGLLLHHF